MPALQPPALRRHVRGQYFVKFRGACTYFSTDEPAARQRYADWINDVWTPRAAQVPARDRGGVAFRVVHLAEHYLAEVLTCNGHERMVQYRSCLAPFVRVWGKLPADRMEPQILQALRTDLSELRAPATVNHTVKAVKRMFAFGAEMGHVPHIHLAAVKLLPRPRPMPRCPAIHEVVSIIEAAGDPAQGDPRLPHWLAINYLALLRPSELVRLVHGEGEWVARGVFMTSGKTQRRTREYRHLILSEEALSHVHAPDLSKDWTTWQRYSEVMRQWESNDVGGWAARKAAFGLPGPRALRAWGATQLRRLGAPQEDIRAVLGHVPRGAFGSYVEEDWSRLRRVPSLLSLRSVARDSLWLNEHGGGD